MAWRDFVIEHLRSFPQQFTTDDLYQLAPAARLAYPENRHVLEKLRQTLQTLRDEGLVRFGPADGTYQKTEKFESGASGWPFQPGALITRNDVAQLFGQAGIGGLRRGMFRPAAGNPWRDHMVLFHDETSNPYGDVIHEGRIVYVGEGQEGDQTLTRNNRHLAQHKEEGVHVHYFVQPRDEPGKIRYVSEVILDDYEFLFRPGEKRSVFEFHLVPTERNPIKQLGKDLVDMLDVDQPGYEERLEILRPTRRIYRDPMFRNLVLTAYEQHCAVCGEPLRKDPLLDLQAAHIVPVAERGKDDVRNGLALCARHHWCFDNGFFTVHDDFHVKWLAPVPDPHKEVREGMLLKVPRQSQERPHSFYLDHHRRKWFNRSPPTAPV